MIKTQHKKIIAFVFLFLLIFQLSLTCLTVSAEESGATVYSNAINDLRQSTSFDESLFPELPSTHKDFYALEVITIAESVNGELFVYVYQPGGDAANIRASHISIARSDRNANTAEALADDVGTFKVYTLTYLNHSGQFYKYKVDDLRVWSEELRYYEISDILRPYNPSYGDKDPGADNTVSAVPYAVGKLFSFHGWIGDSTMLTTDIEYITVTEKYVGYIRYDGANAPFFNNGYQSIDSHFVAFDTDKPIDKLLEADVYYETRYFSGDLSPIYTVKPQGDLSSQYAYLDYEQSAEISVNNGFILKPTTYTRKRIQKTEDFLKQQYPIFEFPGFDLKNDVEFKDDALEALARTKWVLNFVETEYYLNAPIGSEVSSTRYTRVGNVKLLRLKFETDGKIYDLGVVDNMQTGSKDPAAEVEQQDWWQKIMMVLMLLVLLWALTFLVGPIGFVFKIIWKGIKICFKFFVWLLSRPWAIFRWLLGFLDKKQSPKRKKKGD